MRGWNRRLEAWLNGLRTWQFVLTWSTAAVVSVVAGETIAEWLWIGHLNPSALLGGATGSALAAVLFAFVVRDRMREKAKQRANGTVTRRRRSPSGSAR
jgi:ABC-type proline/glycine betaine transport system permease subunit